MIVPKLPGSRTESSARQRPSPGATIDSCGFSTIASTAEGVERWLIRAIAESPISSDLKTSTTRKPECRASFTIFSPSTTKSPDSSRNFFSRRERICFIGEEVIILYKDKKKRDQKP